MNTNDETVKKVLIRNRNVVYVGALLILYHEAIGMHSWGYQEISDMPELRNLPEVVADLDTLAPFPYTYERWVEMVDSYKSDPSTLHHRIVQLHQQILEKNEAVNETGNIIQTTFAAKQKILAEIKQCRKKLSSRHSNKEIRAKIRRQATVQLETLLEELHIHEIIEQDMLARPEEEERDELWSEALYLARALHERLNELIHLANSREVRLFKIEEFIEFYSLIMVQTNSISLLKNEADRHSIQDDFLHASHLAGVESGLPVVPTVDRPYESIQKSILLAVRNRGLATRTDSVQRGEATWNRQEAGLGAAQRRIYGDISYSPKPRMDIISGIATDMKMVRDDYAHTLYSLQDEGFIKPEKVQQLLSSLEEHSSHLLTSLTAQAASTGSVVGEPTASEMAEMQSMMRQLGFDQLTDAEALQRTQPLEGAKTSALQNATTDLPVVKKELCRVCGRNEARKRCCKVARYCSSDCAKDDWPQHKLRCENKIRCENRLNRRRYPSLADLGEGGRFDGFSFDDAVAILAAEAEDEEAENVESVD